MDLGATTEAGAGEEAGSESQGGFSYEDFVNSTEAEVPEGEAPAGKPETDPNTEETPAEGEEEPKKEPEKKAEPQKPGAPTVRKAKLKDGKVIDIPDDAVFVVKVDGKDVEVSLQQALRHEQWSVPYLRRMEELAEKEKAFQEKEKGTSEEAAARERDVKLVATQLKEEVEPLAKEDVPGFVFAFSKMRKFDPQKVDGILRNHYLKEAGLDDDQIKELAQGSGSVYASRELADHRQAQAHQQRHRGYESYVAKQLKQAELSEQEWKEARSKVETEYLGGRSPLDLSEEGFKTYVESVILQARVDKADSRVAGLIDKAAPELRKAKPAEFARVQDIIRRFSDYADEDILAVIKDSLGSGHEEDEALPIDGDQLKARRKAASNSEDDDIERARKEAEDSEDPFAVYR